MKKLFDVQKAIYQRINTDDGVKERVNGIFDAVPDESRFPYIVLGRFFLTPYITKTSKGWQIEQTIDVWSAKKGKEETIGIIDSIKRALEREKLSIDGAYVVSHEIKSIEILEEEIDLFHGTFIYESIIDVEGF